MPDYREFDDAADLCGGQQIDNTPEMRMTPEPAVGSRSEVTDRTNTSQRRNPSNAV